MRHKLTELLDSEAFKEVRKKISDIVGSNFNLSKLNVAIRESEQPEVLERFVPALCQDVFIRPGQTLLPRGDRRKRREAGRQRHPPLPATHQCADPYEYLPGDDVCPDHPPAQPAVRLAVLAPHRDAPAEGKSGRNGRTGNVPQKGPGRFSEEGFELNRTSNSFIHKPILPVYTTISVPKNRAEIVFFSPANLSTFAVPKRRNGNDR